MRRTLSILAIGAALAVPSACGADTDNRDIVASLPLPPDLRKLRVRVPLGDITVGALAGVRELRIDGRLRRSAADPDDFERLMATTYQPKLESTDEPGVYELRVPGPPDGVNPDASAVVFRAYLSLPIDVGLDVETARGTLEVSSRTADVRLRTGFGEIVLRQVHGAADVVTVDGRIFVTEHRGSLRARSGDPEREQLSGAAIVARVLELGPLGVDLATNSPSIQLELPRRTGFSLDARVASSATGKLGIRTGFDVPIVPEGEGHRAVGDVLGGGPPVVLRLGSGWLSVPHGN